jgi:TonB family protein
MKRILILALLLVPLLAGGQERLTVREFLKLSKSDTTAYIVKGVVSRVRSSTSGSFYLEDETGTMLVYGILDPADPTRTFTQMDIRKGDTLSVRGRFTVYGGTTLEMKDGRLIRKADGPDHNLSFYDRLERKPSFKGQEGKAGEETFRQWVQARVVKPAGAQGGTVRVRYVIGRKGAVQEVQIEKSEDPALNEEAIRVVRSAPKWRPAKSEGSTIRVTCFVDIVF